MTESVYTDPVINRPNNHTLCQHCPYIDRAWSNFMTGIASLDVTNLALSITCEEADVKKCLVTMTSSFSYALVSTSIGTNEATGRDTLVQTVKPTQCKTNREKVRCPALEVKMNSGR